MKKILLISLVLVSFSLAGQTQGYPRLIKDDNGLVIRDDSNHLILEDWQPTSESNLSFWLKADDAGTGGTVIKDANNYVSQWADCSGNNAISFQQSTASQQPLWVDNYVNSKPAIRFDQANGGQDILTAISELVISNPCTIYLTAYFPTSITASTGSAGMFSGTTSVHPYCYWQAGNTGTAFPSTSAGNSGNPTFQLGARILKLDVRSSSVTSTLYNQTTALLTRVSAETTSYFSNLGYYVSQGTRNGNASYLMEIIVYGYTTSSTQNTRILNYLKAKYNL